MRGPEPSSWASAFFYGSWPPIPRSEALNRSFAVKRQTIEAAAAPDLAKPASWHLESDAVGSPEPGRAGGQARGSFAGRMGQFLEPAFAPLGFDWKICIGESSRRSRREKSS